MKLIIRPSLIPPEGRLFEGQLSSNDLLDKEQQTTFHFNHPVQYSLFCSLIEQSLLVKGSVSTLIQAECVRCLEEFNYSINENDIMHFYENIGDSDTDIGPDLREDILLAMPIHFHCQENCKGLCPHCGTNLNKTQCQCHKTETKDSIWDSLDQLRH